MILQIALLFLMCLILVLSQYKASIFYLSELTSLQQFPFHMNQESLWAHSTLPSLSWARFLTVLRLPDLYPLGWLLFWLEMSKCTGSMGSSHRTGQSTGGGSVFKLGRFPRYSSPWWVLSRPPALQTWSLLWPPGYNCSIQHYSWLTASGPSHRSLINKKTECAQM